MVMRYLEMTGIAKPVSVIALGTNTRAFMPDAYARAAQLLDAFLDAGGNLIDTAHIYGFGNSEKILGRWLKERGRRDEIILLTKGCHPIVDPRNVFGKPWLPRVTPKAIRADLADSLKRLQTNYVDLYLLHRDDEYAPVGPLIEALNVEQKRGRIRAFGASNWRAARIAEANAYAARNDLNGFVVSSSQFGLAQPVRSVFPGTVTLSLDESAWHAANQFPLLAYSPLGAGYVARAANEFGARDVAESDVYASEQNNARAQLAAQLAARKNVSPTQIALAYALRQNFPSGAVVGPTSVAHLQQLVAALDISLDADEIAFLEQA